MKSIREGDHLVVHGADPETGVAAATVYRENGETFEVRGSRERTGKGEIFHLEPCPSAPEEVRAFHAHSPNKHGAPPMVNSKEYCKAWERIFGDHKHGSN